ncbi:MAG: penicillin-binding protein 2 [Actinomycetota bacterium]|nr:penicillin-binding protein 2 [Actinomycetota bacterium]
MTRPPLGRLVAVFVTLSLGLGGILARLAFLQVKDARAYEVRAFRQRVHTITLPPVRGSLLDRHGKELALSLPAKDVYADPRYVKNVDRTARRVARGLHIPLRTVLHALREKTSFVYLARQVDADVAGKLEAQELPGIGFLDDAKRYYPSGPLASQTLGFVGVDGTGLAGLELQYQSQLAGRPGKRTVEVDPSGHIIPQGVNRDVPPVPGDDVVTTIDREIQYRVQLALAAAVKQNQAKGGTVIVMDPRTGDILALASYPWFDPAHFATTPSARIRNSAIVDAYEPGSVNKVITASAAIQDHVIPLTQTLTVPDHWQVGDHVFHDAHTHPAEAMTLADVIAESSNVGTIRIAGMLGPTRIDQYLARYGLGQYTGIDFPGESAGILPLLADWHDTSMGTIPVGQGLAVTPLQMAAVYAAVANGGVWTQPRLVRGFVDPGGSFHPAPAPQTRRVVSAHTARIVRQILAFAVDAGTGVNAQIPGYWVAGKTGTALVPKVNGLGYSNRYIASFIGMVPASRPQLVVAAIIDQPVTVYGAVAAAPLFQEIARYALARMRISPAPRLPLPPHALSYQAG